MAQQLVRRFLAASLLLVSLLACAHSSQRAQSAELPGYLPADTEILVSVNVRQLVDSDLFKNNFQELVRQFLNDQANVHQVLGDLGLDPLKDIDRVLAVSPGSAEQDRGLVIVQGRFDVEKFKAHARKAQAEHPDLLKAHSITDGRGMKVLVYEVRYPDPELPLFVCVADRQTILASPGKDYVVDALKKIARPARPTLRNKDFQDLLGKMDGEQSLALAVVGNALTRGGGIPEGGLRNALNQVEAIGGGVTIDKDLALEVVVSAKSEAQARQLKGSADRILKQGITLLSLLAASDPQFNPYFEMVRAVRLHLKGKLVTLRAQIDAEVFEELFRNKD
jgi:hypothetical protein